MPGSASSALTAAPGLGAAAPTPAFQLPLGAMLTIGDTEHQVERRLPDGRWQFISTEGTPRFLSDREIAALMKRGEFYVSRERGMRVFAPPPISPLLVGPKAHAENLRKHDYVAACVGMTGRFKRSRSALVPIIEEIAKSRSEMPPGFTTVLNWIDEFERHGELYGTAAYSDRHDLKGGRGERLLAHQEAAIAVGIEGWFQLGSKVQAYDLVCEEVRKFDSERGRQMDKGALGARFVDDHGRLRPPSRRTFERRCAALNRFEQDWALKGPAYAKQKNRTWQRTPVPERPYSEVEVDHTRIDVLIIDDQQGLVLGRPDLIIFRDRSTAAIAGYGLGFEEPSYAAFVQGLRHAIYPKDPAATLPHVTNEWPCFGRIENLFVDNALHFLGDNIVAAGRELGFNLVRFQPRQPWLKGALERFFGTINKGLIHALSGTTLEHVLARRDHEHLGEAVLTLREFEALLNYWIRDVYHAQPTKALGVIRGVGDVPLKAWADKAAKFRTPLLPHPDVFISLAGDVEMRTIQNDGITWDYIIYESPPLWALRSHPKHRRANQGRSTKYEVVRDPFDLGAIFIKDPYNGEVIKVPATTAHRPYATGLGLHQHQVIMAHAKSRVGARTNFDELGASRAILAKVVSSLRRNPGRKRVERAVARYIHVEQTRRHRSELWIDAPPQSGGDFLDLRAPSPISSPAHPSMPPEAPEEICAAPAAVAALPADDDLDDLEALRRAKNWNTYHD